MAPGAGLIGLWGAGSNVLEMPSRVNRIQQLLSDCLSLSAGLPASREEMRPETPLGREGERERVCRGRKLMNHMVQASVAWGQGQQNSPFSEAPHRQRPYAPRWLIEAN